MSQPRSRISQPRSRTPLVIGIVLAVVAVVAIAAVVLTGGDDDDGGSAGDAPVFGTVTLEGEPLPQGEFPDDPSVGQPVPTLRGQDYAGNDTAIVPGADGPLMIVVMAHWCPHCNAEVPLLVEWGESGDVPENLQVVGVSTAAREGGEHFPPATWIEEDMGWTWPVIADDEEQTAAAALGTTGYPYLMFVDADGNLMFRISAELPIEDVQTLADQAAATAA